MAQQEYDKINKLVADGLFLNSADFVREAIREKLKTYDEVVILRDNIIKDFSSLFLKYK